MHLSKVHVDKKIYANCLTSRTVKIVSSLSSGSSSKCDITHGPNVDNFKLEVEIANPSVVPLPAAIPLFASALSLMGVLGWRRKLKATGTAW
tara:strand:- start:2905 stop:3180 length:276 start_codon:yes stop_codon:yes gene_type:complete